MKKSVSENDQYTILDLTDSILFALRENNQLQAMNAVQKIIDQGIPYYIDDHLVEWKFFLVRIQSLIMEVLRHGNTGSFVAKNIEKYLISIDSARSVDECQQLLRQIVSDACEMNREMDEKYSMLVQRIKEQVALDLTQPLTLQYFADLLNVNSSYLSNLFRQQTGVTITEYVTTKRITHAASLLAFTKLPIKTIAKQVGIPDVQYFSRLFKRSMGMTPTQYRNNYYMKDL